MLNQYVLNETTRNWIQKSPINPITDSYICSLKDQGYRKATIEIYIRCVAHFAYWLTPKKVPLKNINETTVERFLFEHLPRCHCPMPCKRSLIDSRASLAHLLRLLRAKNVIPISSSYPSRWQQELMHYNNYLEEVCGLVENTRFTRLHYACEFLQCCFKRRPENINRLKPNDIHQFIQKYSKGYKAGTIQVICSCVRRYLRYRAFCGDDTTKLIAAVPSVAQWRLSSIPKSLTPTDIERILNTFDRTTQTGLRSYAIARCLIDLGLRASEVASIQLANVNWSEGILKINGKGGREDLLPLPAKTGAAMVDYLRRGRPTTTSPALFVRHRAPFDQPIGPSIVRSAMRPAFISCGVNPGLGTHILRHSVACQMLSAGASLKEIADVLRHRSLDTSMIYTKIDLQQLACVVAPWPRRLS